MPDTGLSRKPQIASSLTRCRKGLNPVTHPLRGACLLCNIFQKHRSEGVVPTVFILRVQEASVILETRRRGAPEVVRSRWFAGIPAYVRERRGR